jgi:transcriptional regulator with XRE-family HTH domain
MARGDMYGKVYGKMTRFKLWRLQARLSQSAAARKLKIGESTLALWRAADCVHRRAS